MKQNAAEMQRLLINLDLPDSPWPDRDSASESPDRWSKAAAQSFLPVEITKV
jgi:hypothetical protein